MCNRGKINSGLSGKKPELRALKARKGVGIDLVQYDGKMQLSAPSGQREPAVSSKNLCVPAR
jgi:hypothetical protein